MNNFIFLLFIFGSSLVAGIGGHLLIRALSHDRNRRKIMLGVGLVGLPPILFFLFAINSGLWAWIIFLPATVSAFTAFIVGNSMSLVSDVPKRAGAAFAVVYPVSLLLFVCLGITIGRAQSPEQRTERAGKIIIQALEQVRAERGNYPTSLDHLVPTHLDEIPSVLSASGVPWLYTTDGYEFTLGYMRFPEMLGSEVCLYQSQTKQWSCEFNGWGPFTPLPTWILTPTPQARP